MYKQKTMKQIKDEVIIWGMLTIMTGVIVVF